MSSDRCKSSKQFIAHMAAFHFPEEERRATIDRNRNRGTEQAIKSR
jgi:hypothetical protein